MSRSDHSSQPPTFEVDIRSGRRAVVIADDPPAVSRTLSPVAARKARGQRRLLLALSALLIAALGAIAVIWWLGRPPSDALARVNGEYITVARVDREVLLNRALSALANNGQEVATTRSAVVESLISQRMQAQDAGRAGVTISEADIDSWLSSTLTRQKWTPAQLDEALTGYGLTRLDLRTSIHDTVLINRYIAEYVVRGATDQPDAQNKRNTWLANLQSTSRIERYGNPDANGAPRIGAPAPDFTTSDLDGKPVRLADLRGRPVLINFWATWCQPCRSEIPAIVRVQKEQGGTAGLAVVAVALSSVPDTVTAFRKEYAMTFPIVMDDDNTLTNLYGVGPIPTSFLLDRQGVIRWIAQGSMTDALLQEQLKALP